MQRSLTGAVWEMGEVDAERVHRLAKTTRLSPAAARCLALRFDGDDMPDPSHWLSASMEHLHDPFLMLNMGVAVERLEQAVRDGERIRIITDYDVDGTTSSLILQAALALRGSASLVSYHIPNRFDEGYGFSVAAARKAADDGCTLIVTADIGVRDHAAVAAARECGVDVLICDHHLPAGESVPSDAIVLCPPQAGCSYPNRSLAACGVSLKLAQALLSGHHPKWQQILRSLLKLGAVGTVADLVPLTTLENRAIVSLGIDQLNVARHHPGLKALLDVCQLEPGGVKTSDLGFRIGPRINAAGRVADAKLVVELLNCRDPQKATQLAKRLDGLNTQRKDIQRKLATEAIAAIGDSPDPFVVVAGKEEEGWHRGVVGIVASRIKDDVHRPTAVVSIQGDRAVGSIRSIPSVHAVKALDSVSDLLEKYGGHPAAAGFTVKTADLEAFRTRLGEYVQSHTEDSDLVAVRSIDAEVPAGAVGRRLVEELAKLGPFGMGNPRPRLLLSGARLNRVAVRGSNRSLLKANLVGSLETVEVIWWQAAEHEEAFKAESLDLLGHVGLQTWRGRTTVQFEVKDARVAQP